MPPLKFTEVLSFSSEDPNHPAENLLRPDTYRKWKCAAGSSEKQNYVIIKLERLSCILSVDIGNEGSAFVEVLVAREGGDFQVLLVASSFMTPAESRNASNLSRVRMFGADKLNKLVAEQKWDRLKVICTQPFNKNMQYGLSFITITAPSDRSSSGSTSKVTKLGSFTLKEEEEGDPISVGSVFARRKDAESSSPLTGAAAIRAASASAAMARAQAATSASPITEAKKKPLNAPEMEFYQLKKNADTEPSKSPRSPKRSKSPRSPKRSKSPRSPKRSKSPRSPKRAVSPSESTPNRKHLDKNRERDKDKKRRDKNEKDIDKHRKDINKRPESDKKKRESGDKRGESGDKRGESGDKKRRASDDKKRGESGGETKRKRSQEGGGDVSQSVSSSAGASSTRKSTPFTALLKDVNFVISGYQNPQRSQIRDMMLEMGAHYKPDWGPSCTHLVCAFSGTPKYQQVKGKGRIVSGKWVSDCHKNKIRYPCKRYALVKEQDGEDSEDEVWAEELLPKEERPVSKVAKTTAAPTTSDGEESKDGNYSDDTYSDNEDTDDEIQRVLAKRKIKEEQNTTPDTSNNSSPKVPNKKIKVETDKKQKVIASSSSRKSVGVEDVKKEINGTEDNVYDDDTDIDEENKSHVTRPDTSALPLPSLGDYLGGKNFFLYGNMSVEMKQLLSRYITAFNGKLEDYMTEKVNFVVTEDEWDDAFDDALTDNPSLQFVKPLWIWRCSDKQKLVPFQPYMVVPKE